MHSLFRVADEAGFFAELQRHSEHVVPFIGAGLGRPAGEPSFRELNVGMAELADPGWLPARPELDLDTFDVAEALSADFGEQRVRQFACDVVKRRSELVATHALKGLARVRSKLIITTNYGMAIEHAAEASGVRCESISAADFAVATGERDHLVVMHLHGRQDDAEGIILTGESYDRAFDDERVRQFLRDTALRHKLVFLGQRLAKEERHVIAHVRWAVEAGIASWGPHLLITSSVDPLDVDRLADKKRVESDARVIVLDAVDLDHEYMSTQQAISAVIPLASNSFSTTAPSLPESEVEPYYLALPLAEEAEVNTPGGRGAYIARTRQYGTRHLVDVLAESPRVALVAPGGYGKSVELVHAGRVSAFPALHCKLAGFAATPEGAAQDAMFVANMREAVSLSTTCPAAKLTLDTLQQNSYLFVLDALDEVPADRSRNVAEQIATVAGTFPQHRWLLATRPVPAAELLGGFESWAPFPGSGWLVDYAASRNVPYAQINEVLSHSPQLSDIAEIPVYGAAIVDFTRADKTLPELPIEIIWALNDEREQADEQTFLAPRAQVRVWLDRLALRQQLLTTTETSHPDLYRSSIADDLDHVANTEELLTQLAVRALVTSAGGTVRFPATLSQEARAGQALREAPAGAGLRLLEDHILVTLNVRGPDGRPVRRVRPGWRNLLEMLLPLLDETWWSRISVCDPIVTSRATAAIKATDARRAAAEHIWDHYADRRITLDSSSGGWTTVSDYQTMQRLLDVGPSYGIDEKVRLAYDSTDHTDRSNSLLACPFVLQTDEALSRILGRLSEPNPVVRHYAAQAAMYLQSTKEVGDTQLSNA